MSNGQLVGQLRNSQPRDSLSFFLKKSSLLLTSSSLHLDLEQEAESEVGSERFYNSSTARNGNQRVAITVTVCNVTASSRFEAGPQPLKIKGKKALRTLGGESALQVMSPRPHGADEKKKI